MPNFLTGNDVQLPSNLTCKAKTLAEGIIKENIFAGKFQADYYYQESGFNLTTKGEFEIYIA